MEEFSGRVFGEVDVEGDDEGEEVRGGLLGKEGGEEEDGEERDEFG